MELKTKSGEFLVDFRRPVGLNALPTSGTADLCPSYSGPVAVQIFKTQNFGSVLLLHQFFRRNFVSSSKTAKSFGLLRKSSCVHFFYA